MRDVEFRRGDISVVRGRKMNLKRWVEFGCVKIQSQNMKPKVCIILVEIMPTVVRVSVVILLCSLLDM